MTSKSASTRRSFLKAAPLLAIPLTATAAAAAAGGDDDLETRLARHEDEAAIRALHQDWVKDVNCGRTALAAKDALVRRIAADFDGAPDAIQISPDGQRAGGRFACAVEIATLLPEGGTFAQMARLQGNTPSARTERQVVVGNYVKKNGSWTIARVELTQA